MSRDRRVVVGLAMLVLLSACKSGRSGTRDGGGDSGDAPRDAGPEVPPDVRPDVPPEAGPEAPPDTAPEAPPDTAPEAPAVCNPGNLRCGSTCCDTAPANATAMCMAGTTCGVQCNPAFHACGATTSPCYSDIDVTRCGASCTDCRQPNATPACGTNGCANACIGGATYQFACPAVGGKPSCSRWDFESGTTEGWIFDPNRGGVTPAEDASNGMTVSMAEHATGSYSLAIGYSGQGSGGRQFVFVKVPLCSNGQAVNIMPKTIRAQVRLVTAAGSPAFDFGQGHSVGFFASADFSYLYDFSVDPSTGGSDTGPWYLLELPLNDYVGTDAAVALGFRFLTNGPWTGTIYLDDIRIE